MISGGSGFVDPLKVVLRVEHERPESCVWHANTASMRVLEEDYPQMSSFEYFVGLPPWMVKDYIPAESEDALFLFKGSSAESEDTLPYIASTATVCVVVPYWIHRTAQMFPVGKALEVTALGAYAAVTLRFYGEAEAVSFGRGKLMFMQTWVASADSFTDLLSLRRLEEMVLLGCPQYVTCSDKRVRSADELSLEEYGIAKLYESAAREVALRSVSNLRGTLEAYGPPSQEDLGYLIWTGSWW